MSLIEKEFKDGNNEYWFYRKQQKNLHNIDSFYYTVMLSNDFTEPGDENVHFFVQQLDAFKNRLIETNQLYGDIATTYDPPGLVTDDILVYTLKPCYAHFYNHCVSCPDSYDIFICSKTPNTDTPQIVVQIRSKDLWLMGPYSIYKKSFSVVKKICELYHLHINEACENRCDFAWHTNYLQSPEKYLHIDNFSKMQVSHFKRIQYQYQFGSNDSYENDYIALGKRSDKIFVRMYLKTKEVVENSYKPFFINLWFYNQLISRYDKYILENCYDLKNWKVRDIIRLQFYYDYGSSDIFKKVCYAAMESYFRKGSCNWDYISKLADRLTPKLTTIMNVEFQVMRRMSKSFCLLDLHPSNAADHRIETYLDNHELITDYLLESVLRLVDRNTALKKSQCTDTPFWQSIKRTKMIDVAKKNKNIAAMHRDYSREHSIELVKNSFVNKAVTLGIYTHGLDYKEDIQTTIADTLCILNDNDVKRAERYRSKVALRFNKNDFSGDYDAISKKTI